jgi:prepilin-type N-terminal cleavage/methylation domain-containing protein
VNERGFSLIEVLVTVVIVGIAFAVFVSGMGTAVVASDYHRKQAVVQASTRNLAEAVKAANYVNCATPGSYAAAVQSALADNLSTYSASVTAVKYWNGTSFVTSSCTTDQGLQLISLRVKSTDNRGVMTVDVVKRTP